MAEQQVSVKLTGDNAELINSINESNAAFQAFGNDILKMAVGFASLEGAASKALELVGEGIKAAFEFIPNCIEETDKLGEEFKELHITAGMSTDDFNTYSAAIELSGGKAEDLTSIVSGMEKGIKNNSEVLVANGIASDKTALAHMSLGEYIQAVVGKMDTFSSATDKDQLAMAAFGKSGMGFIAVLKEMAGNLKEGADIAEKSNVVTERTIADLEELTKAKARNANADKELASVVSENTIKYDIAYNNRMAAEKKFQMDRMMVDQMIKTGELQNMDTMEKDSGTIIRNYDLQIKKMYEVLAAQKKLRDMPNDEARDTKQAKEQPGKSAASFISAKDLEDQKRQAHEAAEEKKRQAREANAEAKRLAAEAHADAMRMIREDEDAEKAALKEKQELSKLALDNALADDKMELAIKKADLDTDFNNGKITRQQKLEADKQFVEKEEALEVASITKRIKNDNLPLVEQRKLENQILELHRKTILEKQRLSDDEAKAVRASLNSQREEYARLFDSMSSGFNATVTGFLSGEQTLSDGMKSIGKDMEKQAVNFALQSIERDAGKAGAAAMADHYAMGDVWGAIPAGLEAFAHALSFQSLITASAANGYDIPAGVNPVTQLHEQEMVLPKNLSNKIRNMSDSGGGTVIHMEGAVIAGESVNSGQVIGKVVNKAINNNGRRKD